MFKTAPCASALKLYWCYRYHLLCSCYIDTHLELLFSGHGCDNLRGESCYFYNCYICWKEVVIFIMVTFTVVKIYF